MLEFPFLQNCHASSAHRTSSRSYQTIAADAFAPNISIFPLGQFKRVCFSVVRDDSEKEDDDDDDDDEEEEEEEEEEEDSSNNTAVIRFLNIVFTAL